MFGLRKSKTHSQSLACLLSDHGYSIAGLENKQSIRFCEAVNFTEPSSVLTAQKLREHVEQYNLYGRQCQIILSPNSYQLLLMDALDVPESEMAKALRWQLKGLIDYPLNDIAVDAFIVPPHGAGSRRKKVFAAVTLQSALLNKIELLESSMLNVSSVSIAELALSQILLRITTAADSPVIVISYDEEICQLHVYNQGSLFLFRGLSISKSIIHPNSPASQDMLLEIQRSIDYCLMELKLPEPKTIFFTPSFYEAIDLFTFLQAELEKNVQLLDVNSLFNSEPIASEVMAHSFYAIGGALMQLNERN